MQKIKYMLSHIGKKKLTGLVFTVFIYAIVSNALLFLPLIFSRMLDSAINGVFDITLWILWISLTILGISIVTYLLYINGKLKISCKNLLARKLFDKALRGINNNYTQKGSAYFANLLIKTSEQTIEMFSIEGLSNFLKLISFLVIVSIILSIDILSAIVVILLAIIAIIIHTFGNRYYFKHGKIFQEKKLLRMNDIADTLKGSGVFEKYATQVTECNAQNHKTTQLFGGLNKIRAVNFMHFFVVLDFANILLKIFIVGRAIYLVSLNLPIATAIVLIAYAQMCSEPIQYFNYIINQLQEGWIAIGILMENFPLVSQLENGFVINDIDTIEFINVSLILDNQCILNNINFKIEKNKHYHLSGRTGCGKTSIVKLMLGYFTDFQGEILINNISINKIDKSSIYAIIAVHMQNAMMFKSSIKENIFCGKNYKPNPLFTDFNLENLIEENKLFDKNISGGEQSRILLLRTLLMEKSFIILDEPLEGVDAKTKTSIINLLKQQTANKTLLLISHDEDMTKALTDETIVLN